MAGSKQKVDLRRKQILQWLRRSGKVSVAELSDALGTTAVTIRSDLTCMEREGLLLRVQGGAVLASPGTEGTAGSYQQIAHADEKNAIALTAAELIHDGDTLFINSGSTALFVAESLRNKKNLNVVTNSLAVATKLGGIPSIRVTLLGGEINAQYGFTYGGDTQEQLSRYQADWVILSVEGISVDTGITTRHAEEAMIDRLMINRAKRVLVAADHSKIGRVGFAFVCQNNEKTVLVTDGSPEQAAVQQLHSSGWNIICAPGR